MIKKHKRMCKHLFRLSGTILLILLLSVGIFFGMLLEPKFKIKSLGNLEKSKFEYINNSATFLGSNNEHVRDDFLAGSALYTPVNEINQQTIDAFVSVEDKRFYKHNGVDYARILAAALKNIRRHGYAEGGSTISQQLVKNTHLSNEKTIERKIKEIRIARELERNYSKEEIIKMYLNCLYFGNGIYGIGSATKTYFNKPVTEITLDESAALAAIINSPGKYCPLTKYEDCIRRRNLVLYRMLKNNKISKEEYDTAINTVTVVVENSAPLNQYFNNALFEAAEILDCNVLDIRQKKLLIKTYYDENLNKLIEDAYNETYFESKSNTDFACIIINNVNSEIAAFCGNGRKNYRTYRRSPGSTIKPFISYAPAIESRSVFTISPILDEKTSFGGYSPNNYMDKYLGWISVEKSLCTSSNIAAVKLLDVCGIEYSKDIARKMGLVFGKKDNNLALALGGMENGLTLQEIANAYQTLSNCGKYKKSSCIKSITDEYGKIIYSDSRMSKRAISDETAFLMNSMLQKCAANGTARRLKGLNVAAKTGTNGTKDGNSDAYCISYCKGYTVAVWLGARNGLMPNYISGGTVPSVINAKIMSDILKLSDGAKKDFCSTKNIEKLYVDKEILDKEHRVVLANDMVPPKDKIEAYFDRRNLPNESSIKYFNKFILYKDKTAFSA